MARLQRLRILFFIGVFICTIGAYAGYKYLQISKENNPQSDKLMSSGSLPIVYTMLGDESTNEIHGYLMDMDYKFENDCIVALAGSSVLNLKVNSFNKPIVSMYCKVIDSQTNKTVYEDELLGWDVKDGYVDVIDNIENINQGTDYYLIITINTEEYHDIRYYSRLKIVNKETTLKNLEFAKNISESFLYKDSNKNFAIDYIEPSVDNSNNNLGHVDITSSLKELTWDDLSVSIVDKPTVIITDINDISTSFLFKYKVKAKNSNDVEEIYNVEEFVRAAYYNTRNFLISYDRKVDQVYNIKSSNTSKTMINLGLDSDMNAEYKISENGNYTTFVNEGSLYLMDSKRNQVTEVFTFEEDDKEFINNKYNIKIVNLEENGDLTFLVYGYMNKGAHEGKSGVSLYTFQREKSILEENVYIQSKKPYDLLNTVAGKLCYVTQKNIMYIYLDNSVYSIDLKTKKYIELLKNIQQDKIAISYNKDKIAWCESNHIRILNLETEKEDVIKSKDNNSILIPIDFIGEDFIYGIADKSNVVKNKDGDIINFMSNIVIVDTNLNVIKEYTAKDKFIIEAIVEGNMINIKLGKKKGTGNNISYTLSGSEQIVSNDKLSVGEELSTLKTDLKQTELVIKLKQNVLSSNDIVLIKPNKINTNISNTIDIISDNIKENNYYVYAIGGFKGVYSDKQKAILKAQELKGNVLDSNGEIDYTYTEKFKSQE